MTESREKTKGHEDHTAIGIHVVSKLQLPMNSVFTFLSPQRALKSFLFMVSQSKKMNFGLGG
ncbi:MAG: hypothetical protein ACFFBJ_03420 [Promethearchaeota archaeon]